MANITYTRPGIPYVPEKQLPYNNRYLQTANINNPPGADQLDGDFNALIDIANQLQEEIESVAVGAIPGATDPNSMNKFLSTNGQNPATLFWTLVGTQNVQDLAITANKIANGAVPHEKLGIAAVHGKNVFPGTLTGELLENNTLPNEKFKDECILNKNLTAQCVDTENIVLRSIQNPLIGLQAVGPENIQLEAITEPLMADNSVPTRAVQNGSITLDKLASGVAPGLMAFVGQIITTASLTAPPGCLPCDGASYPTTGYSALFEAIGYTYGGSGANFNVPDVRGRTQAGFAANGGTAGRIVASPQFSSIEIGSAGGEQNHTLTVDEMPNHSHQVPSSNVSGSGTNGGGSGPAFFNITSLAVGGGQSHNNMQPTILFAVYIYAGV